MDDAFGEIRVSSFARDRAWTRSNMKAIAREGERARAYAAASMLTALAFSFASPVGSWANPQSRQARKEEATQRTRVSTHQVQPSLRERRRRRGEEALAELEPSRVI